MSKKIVDSCMACGKVGHLARKVPFGSTGAYQCPLAPGWGKTGTRREDHRCSDCGSSGFLYAEISQDGVRGYRCMECGTIKPEK